MHLDIVSEDPAFSGLLTITLCSAGMTIHQNQVYDQSSRHNNHRANDAPLYLVLKLLIYNVFLNHSLPYAYNHHGCTCYFADPLSDQIDCPQDYAQKL